MIVVSFFFFQAEDGIRDLVRSRGSEMCIRDRLGSKIFEIHGAANGSFAMAVSSLAYQCAATAIDLSLIHI